MAERSIFISKNSYPFFEELHVEFTWFPGFALSQKRKSELSLHANFLATYPKHKPLEVSSSSLMSLGNDLSAMNLSKRTKEGVATLESVFQASKYFYDKKGKKIGPFPEYYTLSGRECKKKIKELGENLMLGGYEFEGMRFSTPRHHVSEFYDFLYLNALLEEENKEVAERLLESGYNAFSDLATKSMNSQARSCAIFVGLVQSGHIDEVKAYDTYLALFRTKKGGQPVGKASYEDVQMYHSGKVKLLSPVARCKFGKQEIEDYYAVKCKDLTNRRGPENYLDSNSRKEDPSLMKESKLLKRLSKIKKGNCPNFYLSGQSVTMLEEYAETVNATIQHGNLLDYCGIVKDFSIRMPYCTEEREMEAFLEHLKESISIATDCYEEYRGVIFVKLSSDWADKGATPVLYRFLDFIQYHKEICFIVLCSRTKTSDMHQQIYHEFSRCSVWFHIEIQNITVEKNVDFFETMAHEQGYKVTEEAKRILAEKLGARTEEQAGNTEIVKQLMKQILFNRSLEEDNDKVIRIEDVMGISIGTNDKRKTSFGFASTIN